MKRTLAVLVLAFAASSAMGQMPRSVAGKPAAPEPKARLAPTELKLQAFPVEAAISLRLKAHTLPRPLELSADAVEEKRLRIGTRRDLATDVESLTGPDRLAWVPSPTGGQVARLSVTSPQAASLRLGLQIRELPAGAELRFTSPGFADRVAGPVAAEDAMAAARTLGAYWTPLTEGETQVVEIWLPQGADSARVRLEVDSASHISASPSNLFKATGLGAAQSCHEDVNCVAPRNPALAQAARSVAKLLYTENGVSYLCSGTLISDGNASSQVPYLYTAAHCIGSQAAAATLNTFWFFESALCGGKAAPNYRQLTAGATLLYANPSGDAALLRLTDRAPEGAWFSGWDASVVEAGASLLALHHPAGDLKKLSLGEALSSTSASAGTRYTTAAWSSGSTEGGSSGSGIFTLSNGEYRLRGGLRGGSASCGSTGRIDDPANRDYYSRIDLEAATLKTWLSAKVAPLEDYTDMWFNPDEPGWGLSIVQNAANRVFAAWYTYDANNQPTWIVLAEGSWKTAVALEGNLYRTSGTAFDRPYEPSRFAVRSVGTGRIEFGHNDTATLTFTVDGKTVVKAIRRQPI